MTNIPPNAGDTPRLPTGFNPYWMPAPQHWAIQTARQQHDQAMYSWGEFSIFVMLWNIIDFQDGLVQRCPTCMVSYGDIADVFKQSANPKCPTCYGTTFAGPHGGIKNRIVRPTIWNNATDQIEPRARGIIIANQASVQSTSDFRLLNGDYVFKADGSRWQVRTPNSEGAETGFEVSTDFRSMIAYRYQNVFREDESSVAYLIPPGGTEIQTLLDVVTPGVPAAFTSIEILDGPLLPVENLPRDLSAEAPGNA